MSTHKRELAVDLNSSAGFDNNRKNNIYGVTNFHTLGPRESNMDETATSSFRIKGQSVPVTKTQLSKYQQAVKQKNDTLFDARIKTNNSTLSENRFHASEKRFKKSSIDGE